MIKRNKDNDDAFERTKEQRWEVVNFKDCRPTSSKNKEAK